MSTTIDLNQYSLVFSDEFNSLNLSSDDQGSTGWNTEYHYGDRFLNGERQVYVDPEYQDLGLNPFSIDNGVLTITAELADPSLTLPEYFSHPQEEAFTSGLITSEEMFSIQYGYFEISAQMPSGDGMWPAFWLLQSDGEWPSEIDVVEVLGNDTDNLHTSYHYVDDTSGSHTLVHDANNNFDSADGFHTYGVDVQADLITWYFDGVQVFQTENQVDDQSLYALINLAVGGWAGSPDYSIDQSYEMQIDYLRVYYQNVDHEVVGMPSHWSPINVSDFSSLDAANYGSVNWGVDFATWDYSATIPDGTIAGYMMQDWNHILYGNDADNYLQGASGKHNELDGRGGDDLLYGGLGTDYFVIRDGDGNDTILDLSNEAGNTDKIRLEGFHFTHFDDLSPFLSEVDGGTMLRLDEDQALYLKDITLYDLSPEQFIFTDTVAAPVSDTGGDTGTNEPPVVNGTVYDVDPGDRVVRIRNFSDDDQIDISDLLSRYDPIDDAISDFVMLDQGRKSTDLLVDQDGAGTDYSFEKVVRLQGTGTNDIPEIATMIDQGNLFVG